MAREASRRELAEILGLGTRQIANLEAEGMPHRADGRLKLYPLPDAVTWYRRKEVDRAVADVQPTSFDESRAREMAARAEKAELEVAELRGTLVRVDVWEREFAAPLAQLRAGLLALPGRLVAELPLPPVEALEIIEPIVHELMRELSETEFEGDGDVDVD